MSAKHERIRRLVAPIFALMFVLGVIASVVDAAGPARTRRPAGVGRGPTLQRGQPPRERGEVPATVGASEGPKMRGTAVYPAQQIPLRFSHTQHLKEGIDCTRCHGKAASSTSSRDLLFPRGASCDECHGAQHPRPAEEPARCSLCHTKVDDAGRVTAGLRAPRPLLTFNHALHMRKGAQCEDCHAMDGVRLATTLQLPRESDCLQCHDGFGATDRCGACHPTESSGRLATRAMDDRALPALVPRGSSSWGMAHDLAFVEDHGSVAKTQAKRCESCHSDQFCTDCHTGGIRPMRIHSGDYLTVHAMDARAKTQDCQACHRTQSFCMGCHERMGFGERDGGAFGVGGGLRFHPADWAGPPGVPQGHAHAAQRNIAACTSCHTEDSCLACHATTDAATPGLDVSPHGRGFRGSTRCQALASHNRRVCLKCHAPGAMELECL
jgi:hypothetical protein